ncbi:RebB family R body protein [Undibacterium amnicola]|uniref:RebB family R body protein n=1 Tax=Undibacterium amnicola TaxID=1834038 RepID=A0ABR6XUQ6_9BURK|nr:RebB family R body protein [Undibacterium amnicola]
MGDIVNPQITDAITQTNVKVLGEAPAMAMGSLYQTIGNSVAMAAANAVYAQQQANVTYQAATTLGVTKLFESSKAGAASFESNSNSVQEQMQAKMDALAAELAQLKAAKSGS